MKFFTALLLPLLATLGSAAILPDTIGAYKRTAVSRPAISDQAIWDEYGLKASETATYENAGEKFTATAYRLADSTGALAAFEWQRPEGATASDVAKTAAKTKTGLLLVDGNYLLSFDGYTPPKPELDAALGSLQNVDASALPVLATYLPAEGLEANSERYVTGPAALQKFLPGIPPSVAAFRFGAEAQIGTYRGPKGEATLAIFNYPTPQIAMEQTAAFQKVPGAVVKRSGPMIAVVVSPPDADWAEHLLSQVRYQAEITRDEYVPTQRDNPGELLYNAFLLIGILLALAVLSGVFFGAIRGFRRSTKKGEAHDAMITLHIE